MDQEKKAVGPPGATAYAELRRLLLPERDDLSRLRDRLSDPQLRAEDVCEVLPAALQMGAARKPELRYALRPLIEDALRISVQKDPAILAETLFPIVGAAVRKAVSATIQRRMRAVNQFVERNLSWRGLSWRFESFKTGKPFAELVTARSLLYRVEHVFLIHRETGLVLQHCEAESVVMRDAETVSGMLAAIQDFVRDSFGPERNLDSEMLRAGDFEIRIQYFGHAVLAAVIRGAPPKELNALFQSVLENIYLKQGRELDDFHGDSPPSVSCQEDLQACFTGQAPEERPRLSPLWWLAAAIVLEMVGYYIFTGWREHRRWDDYLARLHSQPGIVVTSVEKRGSSYFVSGLRDPLAVEPATLIPGTGIDPKNVAFHWELYHSLQPFFEASRRLLNEKQVIENQTLHFGPASVEISEEDLATINQLAADIRALLATAQKVNRRAAVEVIGHTDGTGTEEQTEQIAQARAEAARSALIEAGVPPTALLARGVGISQPLRGGNSATDQLFNRYVSFRVAIQ
jgi:OOP family OmpA-OmpF porin